jgi:predicted transcriptional regulator
MTPDEYRAKWDLKRDYPMVAPSYAAARSNLAKAMGLGRKARSARAAGTRASTDNTAADAPKRRKRSKAKS